MQPPFLSGNYQKRLLKTTEAHLSNGTCDLTIGTQEKKIIMPCPGFHGLSGGVICFVPGAQETTFLIVQIVQEPIKSLQLVVSI